MSLNLKLLRGSKIAYNLWRPNQMKLHFVGRSAMLAKQPSYIALNEQQRSSLVTAATSTAPNKFEGSAHWNTERILAVALLAMIPAGLILESAATDYLLAASLTIHAHWGLQSIVTDYVHGKSLPKYAHLALYAISGLAFAGLCFFNYNDIGMAKAVKKIWTL